MSNRRKSFPLLSIAIFTTLMGLFVFLSVSGNPRFETYRTVDVIRLMAAGAGFGIAFITLIFFFIRPDFRSEDKTPTEKSSQK